jgi:hypothetical protein
MAEGMMFVRVPLLEPGLEAMVQLQEVSLIIERRDKKTSEVISQIATSAGNWVETTLSIAELSDRIEAALNG